MITSNANGDSFHALNPNPNPNVNPTYIYSYSPQHDSIKTRRRKSAFNCISKNN